MACSMRQSFYPGKFSQSALNAGFADGLVMVLVVQIEPCLRFKHCATDRATKLILRLVLVGMFLRDMLL